jgi:hypothetical protein
MFKTTSYKIIQLGFSCAAADSAGLKGVGSVLVSLLLLLLLVEMVLEMLNLYLEVVSAVVVSSVFWLLMRQFKFLGTIEFLVSIWIQNIQILPPFYTL